LSVVVLGSVLLLAFPAAAAAQEATPTPDSPNAVSDNTAAATAAALQNSLQNAQQTLQQGQALQTQMQQQAANDEYRATSGR
jgi:hypothetical protein